MSESNGKSKVNIKEAYKALNTQERMTITVLHQMLDDIKQHPERYEKPVQLIEDIEYSLQGLWKFPRDSSYHTHWLEIKGCTCPRLDNQDYLGFGKIRVSDCPWHWTDKDKEHFQ